MILYQILIKRKDLTSVSRYIIIKKENTGFIPKTKFRAVKGKINMAMIHFNEEGFNKALDSGKLVMVDFWATWCGPCQMLGPVIEQLAEEYESQDVIIGKVDVDENPELAKKYGVMSIPTVVFLKDGEEFDRKVGAMPAEVYADALDEALGNEV